MKKALLAVGVLLLLLVVLVLLLPFVVDLNAYQAHYRPLIEEALNRKVRLKDIRLTIFPRLGVRLADFTVMDDPAFSAGPFASLTSLDVGVKLRPLLSKRVEVEEIILRNPVLTIINNQHGALNISTLGQPGPKQPAPAIPPPPAQGPLRVFALLAVEKLSLTGGQVTFIDQSASKPADYRLQNLELRLSEVGLGKTAALRLAATLQPLHVPLTVDGTFGPLQESLDMKTIALDVALGKTALTVTGGSVGGKTTLAITAPVINTADLPVALPFRKPMQAKDLRMVVDVTPPQVRLTTLSANFFGGRLVVQGRLTTGANAAPFSGTITMQGVQLGPLLEAAGTDRVSITGTAASELALQGRGVSMPELTRALAGTGHLIVKDGTIEGINLLKEAVVLLNAVGVTQDLAKATVFSIIETTLAIKRGSITVERLQMDSQDFQTTATGTIGFDKTLRLNATLTLSEALSWRIAGASPVVAQIAMTHGRLVVPMIIRGTVQAPSYALDTKALGGTVQEKLTEQAKEKLGETLRKLFGQ